MYIENTKHAETNSESCRRENTNKTDHWKFPKMKWSDIYIRMNITRIGCWGIKKKKLFENYKNATKYLNDYYYYYKFVFILGHTKRVTKEYKQEDMYADIIDIQSISTMAWNKMVSVCGYISNKINK